MVVDEVQQKIEIAAHYQEGTEERPEQPSAHARLVRYWTKHMSLVVKMTR